MATPMHRRGEEPPESADDAKGRPGLPPGLTREIRDFIRDHPELGDRTLSDFAITACKLHLARLQRQVFTAMVLRSAKEGRLPPEALGNLRLPDDD